MANVAIQYDFDRNLVRHRFETFCYGPLSCKYYKMGPARAVPYKGGAVPAIRAGWMRFVLSTGMIRMNRYGAYEDKVVKLVRILVILPMKDNKSGLVNSAAFVISG